MILGIPANQRTFWTVEQPGPANPCDHTYEDDDIFDETEYGGSYMCLKCGCKLTFDVSDIGD